MPVMGGYEATMQIRKLPNRIRANVPIIALTANAFLEDKKKAADVMTLLYVSGEKSELSRKRYNVIIMNGCTEVRRELMLTGVNTWNSIHGVKLHMVIWGRINQGHR